MLTIYIAIVMPAEDKYIDRLETVNYSGFFAAD
jgi:hypothetical protein